MTARGIKPPQTHPNRKEVLGEGGNLGGVGEWGGWDPTVSLLSLKTKLGM